MQLSEATGAPQGVAELEAMLSPLDLGDLGEFEAWANTRAIAEAKERVAFLQEQDVLTPDVKRDTYTRVFDSTKNGLASAKASDTLDGTRLLFKLSARHRHPNITDDEINKLVTVGNLSAVRIMLDKASGFGEGAGPNDEAALGIGSSSTPEPTGAESSAV